MAYELPDDLEALEALLAERKEYHRVNLERHFADLAEQKRSCSEEYKDSPDG